MRDHGTHACFVHGPNPGSVKGGCRCEPCRQANAAYERQRSRRTAPPYVAADRARQHLAALSDQGIGLKTVARLSGVSHGALSKLVYGDRTRGRGPSKRIRPATEKAILGVTGAQVDGRHHTHDADDYRDLLDLLAGRGWTTTAIANDQTFIFWPGRGDSTTLAAQDCLDWALTNGEHGVWGGTSDKQRKEMRNGRQPAVAPKPAPVEVRTCAQCGTPLRPTANQSKFCSRSCAMLHRQFCQGGRVVVLTHRTSIGLVTSSARDHRDGWRAVPHEQQEWADV